MKRSATVFTGLGCLMTLGCAAHPAQGPLTTPRSTNLAAAPAEIIPARREFPISDTIEPCDDFFAYACSEVNRAFTLRPDRSRHIYSFSDSHERLLTAKKAWLAQLPERDDLSDRASEIRDFYLACMDVEAGVAEERSEVSEVRSQMDAVSDRAGLQEWLAAQILSPRIGFLSFATNANPDDSDWLDAYLNARQLMFLPERSYYHNPEVVDDYRRLLGNFFHTLGYADAEARAEAVLRFEQALAEVYPQPAEWRELEVRRQWIDRDDLVRRYPNLRLRCFVDALPGHTRIRHFTDSYFDFLNHALADHNLLTLKSVYLFHSLSPIMDDAYPEYFDAVFQFENRHLGGPPQRPDRQERCTTLVMSRLRQELDAELVDVFFPGFDQDRFELVVDQVREAMIRRLNNNTWLSDAGRQAAVRKMAATSMMLVKPRTAEDWNFSFPADYQPHRPLYNQRLYHRKAIEKSLARLAEPRNRNLWNMGPMTVNAYYSPSNNQFVMPVGILQYPFYDPDLPDHVNLGSVGVVVGHELGHAIDDKGSQYDEHGALNRWMTDQDVEEFHRRTHLLIEQFSGVCYDDEAGQERYCHDGELTLGENIGDLTGVAFAYDAALFSDQPEAARRQKQEFFLQYARTWCGMMRWKERQRRLKTDPHALPEARVNEIVKHHPAFYEAYGCDADDTMYLPVEKRVAPW